MSDLLDFTTLLARTAGRILRERYTLPREIHAKGWRDFYTDADLAAQNAIVDLIHAHDPHAAILAEEGLTPPDGAEQVWVIDPLDGTTNYARHIPMFSVSIAVVKNGQPIVGVIYDPLREDLFVAEADRGAQLNDQPLRTSSTADIAEAVIGLDWGRAEGARETSLNWLQRAGQQCRTVRSIGSAALGLCYVAAGWLDVYYHGYLYPWDGAAGQIIAEEAGVKLFDFRGQRWNYLEPSCIAANPRLTEWALASLS